MELRNDEKKVLMRLARLAIKSEFTEERIDTSEFERYDSLKQEAGAFVTLHKGENLRGCIGYIFAEKPLYKTVINAAKQAAFSDPRFTPLNKNEFENISLEISVLSPPFEMKSYDEIILGKHGLILNDMGRRGLLLPQVPIEHNMNKEQYLSAICEKAGLPSDMWKKKQLKIELFTANVFSEEDIKGDD